MKITRRVETIIETTIIRFRQRSLLVRNQAEEFKTAYATGRPDIVPCDQDCDDEANIAMEVKNYVDKTTP